MTNLPIWIRKTLAWSVHLFTATGAVWGFLALRAIFAHEWKLAILWMAVAIFVDGFDGILARWFDVKTYASGVDGALMDNIIDYFTYVVVPALFLVEADLVPPALALPCAVSILLTSAYQFSQVDAKTGMVLGTPSYMSPEQLAGKKIDGRSDLFSLGVTLYQLLCGRLPFEGESMTQLMFAIASNPHPPIRGYNPSLPHWIDAIIDKALAKDFNQRYQTGQEFAEAIRQARKAAAGAGVDVAL